jgi:hypothetical protein
LQWEQVFIDAFAQKGNPLVGNTRRGKGSKCMVVVDGAVYLWEFATPRPRPAKHRSSTRRCARWVAGGASWWIADRGYDSYALRAADG